MPRRSGGSGSATESSLAMPSHRSAPQLAEARLSPTPCPSHTITSIHSSLHTVLLQISGDPKGFDLTGDGERWEAAGGDEISEAAEFPTALYEKWVEVLEAAAPNLEWEPAQWEALWKNLQKWNRALARAGLDFGDSTGMSELQDIGE